MNIGPANTTQAAIASIERLRAYAPFRFGGQWHVAEIDGTGYAFRNKSQLAKKARQAGKTELAFATIGALCKNDSV